jgi:hypothetical protein
MTVPQSDNPVRSLEASVEHASLIAIGKVESVEYRPEEPGFPASSRATVRLREVLKGPSVLASVVVAQIGGPVLTPEGPALSQGSTHELLLPGDEALLMLVEAGGRNLTLGRVGIVFLSNGVARPEESSPLRSQFEGRTEADVVARVRAVINR